MNGEVLSHDEIAALVEAAKDGSLPGQSPEQRRRRSHRVREIDFSRPSKFTQEQQRRFERAHESFCRRASTKLSAELRAPLEFALINTSQLTWSAALAEIPQGALLNVVQIERLGTKLLLGAELDFVLRLIDVVLGGPPDGKVVRRELTDIENVLSGRLFHMIVDPLSLAWEELADLTLSSREVETQATNAQLAPQSEPSLALTFEARVAQSSSTLSLVIPFRSVEPAIGEIGAQRYESGVDEDTAVDWQDLMGHALETVDVEVYAEVGALELSLAELLALTPGSVVRLPSAGGSGVLMLGDAAIHRVRLGQSDGHRAVQVVEPLGERS